jgi:hypothetical protein
MFETFIKEALGQQGEPSVPRSGAQVGLHLRRGPGLGKFARLGDEAAMRASGSMFAVVSEETAQVAAG